METNTFETDYMPPEVKEADVATRYAYVLKAYGDSIIQENNDFAAAFASKQRRKLFKREVDRLMLAYTESMNDDEDEVVANLSKSRVMSVDLPEVKKTEDSSDDLVDSKTAKPTASAFEVGKVNEVHVRLENESWNDSIIRVMDERGIPTTSEGICAYYGLMDKNARNQVRSAAKYLRKKKRIGGIAYYLPPTVSGKGYRMAYFNTIPRFYENNDLSSGRLQEHYEVLLQQESTRLGLVSRDEVERRGGSIVGDD